VLTGASAQNVIVDVHIKLLLGITSPFSVSFLELGDDDAFRNVTCPNTITINDHLPSFHITARNGVQPFTEGVASNEKCVKKDQLSFVRPGTKIN
jgi:hypothetical protein